MTYLPVRSLSASALALLLLLGGVMNCVDPYETDLKFTADVLVVDGAITNLAEPQLIRLNRSRADPSSGIPGSVPVSKAKVEMVVDSAQMVTAYETADGFYQLPSDFRGQIGHAYQLRFTLVDGTRYVSTQQVMPAVPSINRVTAQFNPTSLPPTQLDGFTAAHNLYVDTQDPANQVNYYRWGWKLWESQEWCRTCVQGVYSVNNVVTNYTPSGIRFFTAGEAAFEDCFYPTADPTQPLTRYFVYDYRCRSQCWATLASYDLNIFSDGYTNGNLITKQKVAQIPFYQHGPCLVEIRQAALTPSAYRFYKDLQDQTQNNGGVADTPPTVSIGNVRNVTDRNEAVVGVFTASATATLRYWLDRKDTKGAPPGLFLALNGRQPSPEPSPPAVPIIQILDNSSRSRPYTATCQTPKPDGWRDGLRNQSRTLAWGCHSVMESA